MGVLYTRLHAHLPGQSFWAEGFGFAFIVWGIMNAGFILYARRGMPGLRMSYGLRRAAFMLPMLATFSLALSFSHSRMRIKGSLEKLAALRQADCLAGTVSSTTAKQQCEAGKQQRLKSEDGQRRKHQDLYRRCPQTNVVRCRAD